MVVKNRKSEILRWSQQEIHEMSGLGLLGDVWGLDHSLFYLAVRNSPVSFNPQQHHIVVNALTLSPVA